MPLLRPLDPAFPIERQIAIDGSPVVPVNVFTPSFTGRSAKALPISTTLSGNRSRTSEPHSCIRSSGQNSLYPSSAVASPHLFQKVAVPGTCVA